MKCIKTITILCLALGSLFSCSQNSMGLNVRISAVSDNNGSVGFCVYPETDFGIIANGASVSVVDEYNTVTFLDFSNEYQCFKGSVEATSSKYKVKVRSSLLNEIAQYDIPNSCISKKISLLKFEDSAGDSVLSGDFIDGNLAILLAWNKIADDLVYTINIKTSVANVFSKSTENTNFIIPNDVLEPNKLYFLTMTAQKIWGDPEFEEKNFYSVSKSSVYSLSFYTK